MKILVTGSDGMLATAIRNLSDNFEFDFTFCNKNALDITDLDLLFKYVSQHRFDCIINCAAYTNVEAAEVNEELAYAINEIGAGNIAKAASGIGAKIIHISTDAVYDGKKNNLYCEDDVCNPLSVYSKSKYAGELAVSKYHNNVIIIRTSWLYSFEGENFVTAIINKAITTRDLQVVNDQLGTPTYVSDLANVILNIVMQTQNIESYGGAIVYHYSNEGAITWYDFAVCICKILDLNVSITPVSTNHYASRVVRPFQAILSKAKIKMAFDFTIPHWSDSLEKCLHQYKKL